MISLLENVGIVNYFCILWWYHWYLMNKVVERNIQTFCWVYLVMIMRKAWLELEWKELELGFVTTSRNSWSWIDIRICGNVLYNNTYIYLWYSPQQWRVHYALCDVLLVRIHLDWHFLPIACELPCHQGICVKCNSITLLPMVKVMFIHEYWCWLNILLCYACSSEK